MSDADESGARPSSAAPPKRPGATQAEAGEDARAPKGWHSRGYLPHLDLDGLTQFVTYRLADSLPADVVERLRTEAGLTDYDPAGVRRREFRARVEQYLDAGHGACWLSRADVAKVVLDAWQHFDGVRYHLRAWVVMPNHVHVLVRTAEGVPLSDVLHGWKSFTARQVNRLVGRSGAVWQADYWDTYIRDRGHYETAVRYIHENPVKAGLCASAELWPWSSFGARPSSAALPMDEPKAGEDARAP